MKEIIDIQQLIMLVIQRGHNIADFAPYELLKYPKALSDADGFYIKSAKSDLMAELEKRTNCCQEFCSSSSSNSTIHLFDGMVIVHLLQLSKFQTFGEFAHAFFKYINSFFKIPKVSRVGIIFDRYDDVSIKYLETSLRAKSLRTSQLVIQNPETKIPCDIKIVLSSTKNKLELVRFLCKNAFKYVSLYDNQELIISGGFDRIENCYKIRGQTLFEIPELQSNHLEADTRIFCNALYNLQVNSEIIIHSADTDIFVLAVYFWPIFKSHGCVGLWFNIHGQKSRYLACHVAAECLTDPVRDILPALHAFTGCDTTSKIGTKKKGFDLVTSKENRDALTPLGNGFTLHDAEFNALQRLYLQILGKSGETADEARAIILSRSCGIGINLGKTPCTSNALYLHSLRASAQTYIWKNAINCYYQELDFTQFGYIYENGTLLPRFITKDPMPQNVIKPCNCKKSCLTKACYCKKNSVTCIALCGCNLDECKNIVHD